MSARKPHFDDEPRELARQATAAVGSAAATQAIPVYTHAHDGRLCCEHHEEVEDVQCCDDCPNESDQHPQCYDPTCPDFGDPDFGEGTCPQEHANPQPQRHDGDCQMAQHTYVHQGAPGVFVHGTRTDGGYMLDAVGTNGRRLLVRDDADGIYLGGAVLTDADVLKLAAHLNLMANRRIASARPTCPRCGSPRWVAVSLNEGHTRRRQCVPCGAMLPGVISDPES